MSKIFLLFCTLLALFLSISGFATLRSPNDLPFQLLFLPVTLYLVFTSIRTLPRSRRLPEVSLSKKSTSLGFLSFLFAVFLTRSVLTISQQEPISPVITDDTHIILKSPTDSDTPLPPPTTPVPSPTLTSTTQTLTITHPDPQGEVNIRSGPSTSDQLITKVKNGSILPYLKSEGKWYQIRLSNEALGWIHSDYITKNP